MIKVTVLIEIAEDNPGVFNHLEILTSECEKILKQYDVIKLQRLEFNILGDSIVGTNRKLIATFPCNRAMCAINITQKGRVKEKKNE